MMTLLKRYTYKLLKKSERLTKIDMIYFARGGFWLNINFFVSSIVSFILWTAFANFVSKETYGVYQYILSAASVLTALSLTGANPAIVQSVGRGLDGSMKESIPIQFKWSAIPIAAAIIASVYYFLQGYSLLGLSFFAIAIFLPIINAMNSYVAYLTGKKDFKKVFAFNSIFNAVYVSAMLLMVITTKNPFYIVLTYFAINALMNTVLYFRAIKSLPPNNQNDPAMMPYAKHLSLMNILNTVAIRIDGILIFHYLGAAELAIYSFAKIIPDKITGLFKSIITISLPKLSAKNPSAIKPSINRNVLLTSFVGLACAAVFIVIAPIFYKIFFPTYLVAVPYAQIYSLTMATLGWHFLSTVLISQKATKSLYFLNVATPTIQLIILFVLIYNFGLLGGLTAKIINQLIGLVIAWTTTNYDLAKRVTAPQNGIV